MKTVAISEKSKSTLETKTKEIIPTKIVIRNLPPTFTADLFIEEVSPLAEHNYFNFVPADKSLGQFAFSKAFINFKNPDDLFLFRERFDNYVFVDTRGNEYPAVVEFAPYQKIPLKARKLDHRENTLDEDADYKKFLEQLENPEPLPSFTIKEVLEEVDSKAKERLAAQHNETPLLAFINKFKIEKRRAQEKLKEERRLKELERKRMKEEDRRLKRERDRKEMLERKQAGDSGKSKDAITVKTLSSSSVDRRDDSKRTSAGKGEKSTAHGYKSSGSKAELKSSTASKSLNDKPRSAAVSQKRDDDGIIVRTLPSSKSKSSKLSSEKTRPSSSKTQPSSKSTSKPTSGASAKPSEMVHKDVAPQKVLAGKQQSAGQENDKQTDKSSRYSASKTTLTSTRSKDSTTRVVAKQTEKDVESADGVADKPVSVKLKARAKSQDDSESTNTSASEKNGERRYATDDSSAASDIRSDNSEAQRDRVRPLRNTRYKDRPERAIYNPGAKAAERRQKQQTGGPEKTNDKVE
ncbi:hypothetical protein EB796_004251 [Bugula neritina]|uniref:UPF3 domain-containing protein n=1 Tax=Bugula neritina TaxID=10212 RepID=A0A7J7KFJ5_BUGNE|nr:hypothetical protein EB796_004251 [Bugula neritina]